MKHHALWKGALAGLLALGLSGCTMAKQEPFNVIVKVPTLSINSVVDPDLVDSAEFLQLAVNRYKEEHPNSPANYIIEVFEYVDEEKAITESYAT